MRKTIFISIFMFLLLSCETYQTQKNDSKIFNDEDNSWTMKNLTQNREMSQYELGGHFWCSLRPFGNEQDKYNGEKKVRDFIWKNWTEKKLGYIKISCGGIDTSDTSHYFIEPNEKGEWIVAVRTLYKHSISEYDNRPITDSVAVSIKQDKTKENKKIVLKSSDDKIIREIPFYY